MDVWLSKHLESLSLTDEAANYLLSRGVREDHLVKMGFKVWQQAQSPAPDTRFFNEKRYGPHGENLCGWLIVPIYCPRGNLLGFEARNFPKKVIERYLLGRAEWNPVWYGIQTAMPLIWKKKAPWIFEGYFDVEVMRHILPDEPLLGSFRAKLTDKHVEFLRRFLPPRTKVRLVYDNDETGQKGIKKARFALERAGLKCLPVLYKGKDPNSLWETRGIKALREEFNQ